MNLSIKRSIAILQKDYKDVSKNLYVSTTFFMPILFAVFYGRMGVDSIDAHYLIINMTFCLVAAYIQSSLIAEEKEKNTLRGLMLSPASTLDILVGKSLLSFISTIIVIVIAAFLSEYRPENLFIVSIAIILSTIFYIGLGTVLGLVTKSVMEASVVIMPFFFLFSFGTFLMNLADKYPVLKVAEYLPNIQIVDLANEVQLGAGFSDVWVNLLIIFAWVVAIFALVLVVYRKRMMD